ncbi:pyrin and HIN domain-containing protein 1-like [Onychomys torridus]|uniref:pyrin and HIN domain-containing protein 1-like n=1 Tax=Onychomys torridus TaxID=38674 RepID=UPI00167F4EBD|nr:pyrin and HIN domain-containing protein 1-like [Onychomys torridus]
MVNEHKKIVLLVGLMGIGDDDFKMVKSLLSKELKLNRKMQDDYDRIKIADLMEDKFPKDAGMDQLIDLYKEMPGLGDLADKLKKEKAKAKRKQIERRRIPTRGCKRDEASTSQPMSTTNEDSEPESGRSTSNSQAPRLSLATASNRDQATQVSPVTASISVQVPEVSPARASSSAQVPRVSITTASSSAQAPGVSLPTASSSAQAPGVFLPTASSSAQVSRLSLTTASSSAQDPRESPAIASSSAQVSRLSLTTASSSAQVSRLSLTTASSSALVPRVSPARASSSAQAPGVSPAIPVKKPRLKTVPKQPSKEEGHHQGPKKVMVLKATEPFTYDMRAEKRMFHATVATETEFFRVKVFNIVLKEKFIPNKVITISDYVGRNGFINIYHASSVSEVNDNQLMDIPTTLRQRANATPKINYLCSKRRGIFVNGVFMVSKKNERGDFTYYEIQDNTGMMEVVVYGRLTNVDCNPGDKLRLLCFELTSDEDKVQLKSTRHSNMKVIRAGRGETTTQPCFSYGTS